MWDCVNVNGRKDFKTYSFRNLQEVVIEVNSIVNTSVGVRLSCLILKGLQATFQSLSRKMVVNTVEVIVWRIIQ